MRDRVTAIKARGARHGPRRRPPRSPRGFPPAAGPAGPWAGTPVAGGVMIYALLRRYGLPGWGATLAALPVLLDAYQVELEHEILPSATFGFLVMAAITLTLWWRRDRPLWATVVAGFVLAAAATLWPVGLPVLIVFLLYLTVRRVGWRAFGAAAAAGAVSLAGYVLWFHGHYGRYALSNSDSIYLWSRTMTFANCAVIRPPADELVL